ncbi:DciA family protein [Sorangium sp. So ce513]|uniref:DciA family protein n=1 Tax=Sorangium sp. So ce513 TaxID=3133315 RepID=UPI003F5D7C69
MSRRIGGIERLGALIQRNSSLSAPAEVDTTPMPFRDWEAAVGSRIAARARPLKLERGVLHVRAASSTWAQELSMLGDAITTQLRARGLPVQSLRFRVGKVEPVARPPWREEVRPAPKEAPLPIEVRQELGNVADLELRDAIAKAAARNLGWQEAEASVRPRNAPPPLPPAAPPPLPRVTPRASRATPPQMPGTPPPAPRAAREAPPPAPRAAREAPPAAPRAAREAPPAPRATPRPAAPLRAAPDDEAPSATSPRRAARDPRSAASRTARSDRTKAPSGEGRRGRS